ncbi:HNH endonuclease [bacterium]|nr:HNH endonuclease [bacterium]
MVAAAFFGPPPPGHIVNHLDGRKNNDRLDNLEYTTHRGNARHAAALGLLRPNPPAGRAEPDGQAHRGRGARHAGALPGGTNAAALGREYGVTQRAAHMAATGRTWRHVA